MDGSGFKRKHVEIPQEHAEEEQIAEVALPSSLSLDDILMPQEASMLEAISFFGSGNKNIFDYALSGTFSVKNSPVINLRALVSRQIDIPNTNLYSAGYGTGSFDAYESNAEPYVAPHPIPEIQHSAAPTKTNFYSAYIAHPRTADYLAYQQAVSYQKIQMPVQDHSASWQIPISNYKPKTRLFYGTIENSKALPIPRINAANPPQPINYVFAPQMPASAFLINPINFIQPSLQIKDLASKLSWNAQDYRLNKSQQNYTQLIPETKAAAFIQQFSYGLYENASSQPLNQGPQPKVRQNTQPIQQAQVQNNLPLPLEKIVASSPKSHTAQTSFYFPNPLPNFNVQAPSPRKGDAPNLGDKLKYFSQQRTSTGVYQGIRNKTYTQFHAPASPYSAANISAYAAGAAKAGFPERKARPRKYDARSERTGAKKHHAKQEQEYKKHEDEGKNAPYKHGNSESAKKPEADASEKEKQNIIYPGSKYKEKKENGYDLSSLVYDAASIGVVSIAGFGLLGASAVSGVFDFFKSKYHKNHSSITAHGTIDSVVVPVQNEIVFTQEFRKDIESIINRVEQLGYGNVSISIRNNLTGEYYGYNDKKEKSQPSTIKAAIAFAAAYLAQNGLLNLNKKIDFDPDLDKDLILQRELADYPEFKTKNQFDYSFLQKLMIRDSVNTPTNLILKFIGNGSVDEGIRRVNQVMAEVDLSGIKVEVPYNRIFDYTKNVATTEAIEKLMGHILKGRYLMPEYLNPIKEDLENERHMKAFRAIMPGVKSGTKVTILKQGTGFAAYLGDYTASILFSDSKHELYTDKATSAKSITEEPNKEKINDSNYKTSEQTSEKRIRNDIYDKSNHEFGEIFKLLGRHLFKIDYQQSQKRV